MISVCINTHKEGADLKNTIESYRAHVREEVEFVVGADRSTDGSTDNLGPNVRVIPSPIVDGEQIRLGCGKMKALLSRKAKGGWRLYSDGHMRVAKGSLDDLALVARATGGVVCPLMAPLHTPPDSVELVRKDQADEGWSVKRMVSHGLNIHYGGAIQVTPKGCTIDPGGPKPKVILELKTEDGRVIHYSPIQATVYATFGMTKETLKRIGGWNKYEGRWGSQEIGLALRCWFTNTPIYLVWDVLILHRFAAWWKDHKDQKKPHYSIKDWETRANERHALQVVFRDETFENYWKPMLKENAEAMEKLAHGSVAKEHEVFMECRDKAAPERTDEMFFKAFAPQGKPNEMIPYDDVTALVLTWKRPEAAQKAVNALLKRGIKKVWALCNENAPVPDGVQQSIRFSFNSGTWSRWALASIIPTPYALIVDDDVGLTGAGIEALLMGAKRNPGRVVGLFGKRFRRPWSYLECDYFKAHKGKRGEVVMEDTEVDMLWPKGVLAPRDVIQRVYGNTEYWDAMRDTMRKVDGIDGLTGDDLTFGVALPCTGELRPMVVPARDTEMKEYNNAENQKVALWKVPGRKPLKKNMLHTFMEMGWMPWALEKEQENAVEEAVKWATEHKVELRQNRTEIGEVLQELYDMGPRTLLEIGSLHGANLWAMAGACVTGAKLIGLDAGSTMPDKLKGHPERKVAGEKLSKVGEYLKKRGFDVSIILGDSHADETQAKVEEALGERTVDVLYIDGDHSEAGCWEDVRRYGPLVGEGGLIFFHDIVNKRCGVKEVWKRVKSQGWTREIIGDPKDIMWSRYKENWTGVGLLRKTGEIVVPEDAPKPKGFQPCFAGEAREAAAV